MLQNCSLSLKQASASIWLNLMSSEALAMTLCTCSRHCMFISISRESCRHATICPSLSSSSCKATRNLTQLCMLVLRQKLAACYAEMQLQSLERYWSYNGCLVAWRDERANLALHERTQSNLQHERRDIHHPSHTCT